MTKKKKKINFANLNLEETTNKIVHFVKKCLAIQSE